MPLQQRQKYSWAQHDIWRTIQHNDGSTITGLKENNMRNEMRNFQASTPPKKSQQSVRKNHTVQSIFLLLLNTSVFHVDVFLLLSLLLLFNSVSLNPQSKTRVAHTVGLLHFKLHFWFMFSMLSEGCAPHLILMSGGGDGVAWKTSFFFFIFL